MKIIYVDHNCEEPYEGVKFDDENRKEFNLCDDASQDCLEEEWDEDHVLDDHSTPMVIKHLKTSVNTGKSTPISAAYSTVTDFARFLG